MTEDKTDRRVRKTKALLQQSLIRLMAEKEINDISVKELADLADINRGTFYLHYTDIYDMLHQIEKELFVEFNRIFERSPGEPQQATHKAVLAEVFSFLERHYDMARVMIGPHGDLAFVNGLKNLVTERLQHLLAGTGNSRMDPTGEYYYSFIVSGYVGVIETWLKSPHPLPAEKMAEICSLLMNADP
ncbi:MAG: TetR/AcrR family transcriptional regulator [Clostridium sp.]|nr:TetR/AcrR family transcriptional regulator [Acetatifactor muris]MCM1526287.1 TetR/AcrR family transcriptional regulator [Bacteroides sp.]MCM1562896.1 TetR/AcrR family transcriptional regulator [Clostridium sp.]